MGGFNLMHIVLVGVAVVVIVLLLWPTERSGRRLLRSWGLPDADRNQSLIARRYLLVRRIPAAVLLVLPLPLLGYAGWGVVLLGALLLAESAAAVAPVRGDTRTATLRRRGLRDLAPAWTVVVLFVFAALAVVSAVLVWVPVVRTDSRDHWVFSAPGATLAIVGAAVVAAGTVVQLAKLRPSVGDVASDAALRVRSARVAIALATALVANQAFQQLQWIDDPAVGRAGWCVLAAGIAAWILIANPLRRPRLVTAVR